MPEHGSWTETNAYTYTNDRTSITCIRTKNRNKRDERNDECAGSMHACQGGSLSGLERRISKGDVHRWWLKEISRCEVEQTRGNLLWSRELLLVAALSVLLTDEGAGDTWGAGVLTL